MDAENLLVHAENACFMNFAQSRSRLRQAAISLTCYDTPGEKEPEYCCPAPMLTYDVVRFPAEMSKQIEIVSGRE